MTVFLSALSRRRISPAISAFVVGLLVLACVQAGVAARSKTPAVGDYLERVTRAMGLDSGGKPLESLVQQGVIDADAARGLRNEESLTRDLALGLSSRLSDPPAPSFLSRDYVAATFLGDHGKALGFVRDDGSDEAADEDLFHARHHRRHHCPTPRHRPHDDDDRVAMDRHLDDNGHLASHRHHHEDDRPCPRDP